MRSVASHATDAGDWVNVGDLRNIASVESFELMEAERDGPECLVASTTHTDSTAVSSDDMSLLDVGDFEFPEDRPARAALEGEGRLAMLFSAKRSRLHCGGSSNSHSRSSTPRVPSASPKRSLSADTAYDDADTDSYHDVACALPAALFRKRRLSPCLL
ncbi:hypothetical protein DIPPA_15750 [Diplonema papillatum]|nr:hypothetical protein DIPPA_15750 [Diplonema papillatum]|eukprot:gene3310-5189_t